MKIKPFLKSVLSIITDIKIYIGRTMSWISMANSLMLVFLVIERLNSLGVIKGDLGNSVMLVVGVWFVILIVLGWFEVNKLRAPHLESEKILKFNLPLKEIRTKIREIDKRTKKIEEDLKNIYSQQKQVKQVPCEDDYFSESKASPDNVDDNNNEEDLK